MILTDELRNASLGFGAGRSFQLITRHDAGSLHAFYRSLSFDERRSRFGAGVSEESIALHCERIDWRATVIIGFGNLLRWEAVSTIVRIDRTRAENATMIRQPGRPAAKELLRLSAIAARELLSVPELVFDAGGAPGLLPILREIGSVTMQDGVARLATASVARSIAGGRAQAAE